MEELKAKLAESEQARKRDMLEKESLSKDKKMLEIHRDLLEHQLTVCDKETERKHDKVLIDAYRLYPKSRKPMHQHLTVMISH